MSDEAKQPEIGSEEWELEAFKFLRSVGWSEGPDGMWTHPGVLCRWPAKWAVAVHLSMSGMAPPQALEGLLE